MESKIRIKLGPIEIEYEGSEQFLKQELSDLVKTVLEIYKANKTVLEIQEEEVGAKEERKKGKKIQFSTSNIAAKLPYKKGAGLILAAAAHLTFVKEMDTFSRQALIDEMKTASAYFKESYRDNLSSYLNRLIRSGKINEPSKGTFALSPETKFELESTLD